MLEWIKDNWSEILIGIVGGTIIVIISGGYSWLKSIAGNRLKKKDNIQKIDTYSRKRISPNEYMMKILGKIERIEITEIQESWEGGNNNLLLVGEGGAGKSGIVNNLAAQLRNDKSNLILFIDARDYIHKNNLVNALETDIILSSSLSESIIDIAKDKTCYLIIDQLDSIIESEIFGDFILWMKSLKDYQKIRILGVVRSYEFKEKIEFASLEFKKIISKEITEEMVRHYFSELNIETYDPKLEEIATNLLNLSLIADVVEADGDLTEVSSQVDLWDKFLETIEKREGDKVLAKAIILAVSSLKAGDRNFPISDEDQAVRNLLSRAVLFQRPDYRYQFRHEHLQEYLCARYYVSQSLDQLLSEISEFVVIRVLRWYLEILYSKNLGRFKQEADQILSNENIGFFTRTVVLDILREKPSNSVLDIIDKHLKEEQYAKYFFAGLTNPEWADILSENEAFFIGLEEPFENDEGILRYYTWWAGDYLMRIATQRPEIVIEIVESFESFNVFAIQSLLKALVQIDPAKSVHLIDKICDWLNEFRASYNLITEIREYIGHLVLGEHYEQALIIFLEILEPLPPEEGEDITQTYFSRNVRTKFSKHFSYEVKKLWESFRDMFVKHTLAQFIEKLEEYLKAASRMEYISGGKEPKNYHSAWRNAVEDNEANYDSEELKNLYVEGIRECLLSLCDQEAKVAAQKLEEYLQSEYRILQRIAIYVLSEKGEQYQEITKKEILKPVNSDDYLTHHESYWLLNKKFGLLTIAEQQIYLIWQREKTEREFKEAQHLRKYSQEEQNEILLHWLRNALWSIKNYLIEHKEFKELLDGIIKDIGEPKDPVSQGAFISYKFERVEHETSGLSFHDFSISGLADWLYEYEDGKHQKHTQGDVITAITDVIQHDFQKWQSLTSELEPNNIRLAFVVAILNGYRNLIKAKQAIFISNDLVSFVRKKLEILSEEQDKKFSYLEIAWFIQDALIEFSPIEDADALDLIFEIIQKFIKYADPTLEEDSKSDIKYSHEALNSVAGMGMRSLFAFARYRNHYEKEQAGDDYKPFLPEEVKEVLEQKLDKQIELRYTIHSVFGHHLGWTYYYDEEWVSQNLHLIFPDEPERIKYWIVAWQSLILLSTNYRELFEALQEYYLKATNYLEEISQNERWSQQVTQRMGRNIVNGYLVGLYELDGEILQSFFAKADDQMCTSTIHAARNLVKDSTVEEWQRMDAFFQWRLDVAENNPETHREEITAYLGWLQHIPDSFENLYEIIRRIIPLIQKARDIHEIMEYIAEQSENSPKLSVMVLEEVLQRFYSPWILARNMETVIKAAVSSSDKETRQAGARIINQLGEFGNYTYRSLLPDN